jgi:hypothetical protein
MAWSRTFTQMKTDIGLWLGVDPDSSNPNTTRLPTDVRASCVQQARRELALRRDLRFLEDTDTITTASGDYDYGLPSDWLRPYYAYYLGSDGSFVDIAFLTRAEWDEKYAEDLSSETGSPVHICVYGDEYLVGPVPDAIYSIYVHYFKQPVDLTGSNDDDFLTFCWEPIFWGACLRACDYLMEDTRRPIFQARYDEAVKYMTTQEARAKWSARRLVSKISKGL